MTVRRGGQFRPGSRASSRHASAAASRPVLI